MVSGLFESILQELGTSLGIQDLHPDKTNSCLLKFRNGVQIQLEFDKSGGFLIIGSELGTVPSGRYRENIFREALKSNGLPWPRNGTFAYSKKANQLVLFEMLSIRDINVQKILDVLKPFSEKAHIWKEALSKGDVPIVSDVYTGQTGMFGLR